MDMETISIPVAKEVIHHIAVGQQEPIMFWGKPGVGKSQAVAQCAKEHGGALVDIRLSQYDSVDLRGIPVPSNDLTVWHAPSTIPFKNNPAFESLDASKPIFMFLDEINAAVPSTAAVAYQLVNDRRVGEHELLPNVVIIAAGNREQDRGVTNRMPTPLANRLTHFEIDVDVNAWCYHAQEMGWAPEGIAFMQFRKELLSTFDPTKPDKAFATPRSWEKALNYYADAQIPDHVKQASMTGAVGAGPSAEFWGFIDVWKDLPDMKDIEANPDKVPAPEKAAMRYAVSVAISGTMNIKNAAPFTKYLKKMDPEFGVLAWQLALKRDQTVCASKEFIDFAKEYRSIFAR